jgi:Uma2 family endonuclease
MSDASTRAIDACLRRRRFGVGADPERPNEWPVRVRPDWVGEIVSPRHEKDDLVTKPRTLHAAEVPHYWVLDPEEAVLLVHRWSKDGYIVVVRASIGEIVRAEPFDAIELDVAALFGIESEQ